MYHVFTFHWLELRHLASPNDEGGREMESVGSGASILYSFLNFIASLFSGKSSLFILDARPCFVGLHFIVHHRYYGFLFCFFTN